MPHTFDYIVIGAGTAGCVLRQSTVGRPAGLRARRRSGGMDDYAWIHIPVGYLYCIDNPRTDWRFRTEPEAGLTVVRCSIRARQGDRRLVVDQTA